jgi:nucleolar protein 16
MRNMGLVSNPGQKDVEVDDSQPKKETVIQLYDIPESDSLQKKTRPLSAQDQRYIAKCMTKYGDDYTAMFRDIKVNNMQCTETQLRKMASRFLLLDEEQRTVQVPEKIEAL